MVEDLCFFGNGQRKVNAGFIKLVHWKEKDATSFQLYISNLTEKDLNCGIKVARGSDEIVLGQVNVKNGKGMTQIEDLEEIIRNLEQHGCRDDVVLRVEIKEGCGYQCVIREGSNIPEENMAIEAAEVEAAEKTQDMTASPSLSAPVAKAPAPTEKAPGQAEENPVSEKMNSMQKNSEATSGFVPGIRHVKSDKWQQLWTVMPHIRPFDDEREYLQVEHLQDMVVLSGLFYRLVENSFLLHGYYNYGHLILTRMRKKDKEKIYIGVPGNYYVKEAQVAVMFGFESFEPKTEPAREGDFGYYMIGVDI